MKEWHILVNSKDINEKADAMMKHLDEALMLWEEIEDFTAFIDDKEIFFGKISEACINLGIGSGIIKIGVS